MHKKFKIIYIPIFLMMVIGSLVIGITDYITAGFSFDCFKEATFWINIVCTNTGTLSLIISVLLIKIDKFKETNKDYLLCEENIHNFYFNSYVAPVFKKFCYDVNCKTKVIVYKNKINKKYSKLKPTTEDLDIYYSNDEEAKKKNKYCVLANKYNRLLSDEYIRDFLPKININYPRVNDSIIFTGCKSTKEEIDFITTNKTRKVFFDLLPKYLISLFLITFIAGITTDWRDDISKSVILKTIIKVFTILSQLYFAYNYANRYNNEVTLHDIHFRNNKINEYTIWENRQIESVKNKNKEVNL